MAPSVIVCHAGGVLRLLIGALVSTAALSAFAQKHGEYNVTHHLNLTPSGANQTYAAGWQFSTTSHADQIGCDITDSKSGTVNAPAGLSDSRMSSAVCPNASASGEVRATVGFTTGGPFTATVVANGKADASPPPQGRSHASSRGSSEVRAQSGRIADNGKIIWGPVFSVLAHGSTSVAAGKDPIFFSATDLVDGRIAQGTLIDIEAQVSGDGGDGALSWLGGVLSVDAFNASLLITVPGLYTLQHGSLHLEVVNGLVSVADGSGLFAGLLPGVGGSGNFSVPLGDITLDYDFGFGNDDVSMVMNFENGGSADVQAVPEPANFALILGGLVLVSVVRRQHRRAAGTPKAL